jgi:hypothetical protein
MLELLSTILTRVLLSVDSGSNRSKILVRYNGAINNRLDNLPGITDAAV